MEGKGVPSSKASRMMVSSPSTPLSVHKPEVFDPFCKRKSTIRHNSLGMDITTGAFTAISSDSRARSEWEERENERFKERVNERIRENQRDSEKIKERIIEKTYPAVAFGSDFPKTGQSKT